MAQVIAGVYEIEKQIGAGGGGVVYLGRHLRLEKQVVLKADKRRLSTSRDTLRREVDMLKGLSHTYIPQVYDFVQEDETVYSVMDFIEGESLDKMLARQQKATQPQLIKWAGQILEALAYLHSQPPYGILHGDIKPANIMLRPNGDICLIDYNIALALGEDGAVKVGYSRGYASPEHYGIEYANRQTTTQRKTQTEDFDKTEVDNEVTVSDDTPSFSKSASGGRRSIMLDVRSDIYSLGATLYHLISGRRPEQDAQKVVTLGPEVCSAEVSAIIRKAMAPDPKDRYQTAEEMLTAFRQLHKKDRRVLRYKRQVRTTAILLSSLFLAGGGCTFVGLKQLEQRQQALTLAEYSANALAQGEISQAVSQAMEALPKGKSILEAPVTAEAQKALTDALGVYDLKDGFQALDTITLPAAPFDITLSPKGDKVAVVCAYEVAVYDLESQEQLMVMPTQESALSDCVWIDDERIAFAAEQGVMAYQLDTKQTLWTGEAATTLSLSADGGTLAAVNRDQEYAVIYRVSDGNKEQEINFAGRHLTVAANDIFADPQSDVFSLNADGSLLAVSFSNGDLEIYDRENLEESLIVEEQSGAKRFTGGFCGQIFAYVAGYQAGSTFQLVDVQAAALVGGYESQNHLLLQTDEEGIYLADANLLVRLSENREVEGGLQERELAYTDKVAITAFSPSGEYTLLATEDGNFAVYDAGAKASYAGSGTTNYDFVRIRGDYGVLGNGNEPTLRIIKRERVEDAPLLTYDAYYEHDEARVSQDGSTFMLFGYQDFRIYDRTGAIVTEVTLPDAETIYDQQFIREGQDSWLEVTWYDGMRRCYRAADGELMKEEQGAVPGKDLYEEFYTETYRITSSLHSAPEVYLRDSDIRVALLQEDDYLTYVTQVGDYLVTEYINTAGERYGLLLDEQLETIAYLPNLCDIAGEQLIFDYKSGNLRQCRLYSLQELVALGETYLSNVITK